MHLCRLLILPAIALALAGCNTVAGVGQDMQQAGTAVSQEAHQAQSGM